MTTILSGTKRRWVVLIITNYLSKTEISKLILLCNSKMITKESRGIFSNILRQSKRDWLGEINTRLTLGMGTDGDALEIDAGLSEAHCR